MIPSLGPAARTKLADLSPIPYRGYPNREIAWADREHLVYFDQPPMTFPKDCSCCLQ